VCVLCVCCVCVCVCVCVWWCGGGGGGGFGFELADVTSHQLTVSSKFLTNQPNKEAMRGRMGEFSRLARFLGIIAVS